MMQSGRKLKTVLDSEISQENGKASMSAIRAGQRILGYNRGLWIVAGINESGPSRDLITGLIELGSERSGPAWSALLPRRGLHMQWMETRMDIAVDNLHVTQVFATPRLGEISARAEVKPLVVHVLETRTWHV
jgi:hypothetical protein